FDGRVVGNDDGLAATDSTDAGEDAGRRRVAVVHLKRGQRRQLEERTAGVNVALASGSGTALANPIDFAAQALDQRVHRVAVAAKLFGVGVEPGFYPIHLSVLDACWESVMPADQSWARY